MIWRMKWGDTIWWSNTKGRMRQDTLLGFVRTYSRDRRKYIYKIVVWKLIIGVMP